MDLSTHHEFTKNMKKMRQGTYYSDFSYFFVQLCHSPTRLALRSTHLVIRRLENLGQALIRYAVAIPVLLVKCSITGVRTDSKAQH